MKALILVGGYGTRLRPLTLSTPKPLIQFANKPIIEHQIKGLYEVGVKQIILAVGYQSQKMQKAVEQFKKKYGIDIMISKEQQPLGTAGPIKLAQSYLKDCQFFFVLNSDIICEFPFKQLIEFHKKSKRQGSITLTKVSDPSRFGVIVMKNQQQGIIQRFVEKPIQFISNNINAGIYILNWEVISWIESRPTSIQRQIFPMMVKQQQLAGYVHQGYWMDIGKPQDYLDALDLFIKSQLSHQSEQFQQQQQNKHNNSVIIHPQAKISQSAKLGPNVTIGKNCVIGEGVRIKNSAILESTQIGAHSFISNSIIGNKCKIGEWNRMQGLTVIADDVNIKDQIFINKAMILPNKIVDSSIYQQGKIIM